MELLTVQETAKLLKVSPITIRRYIKSGRLAAVKVGRAVRIRREAVEGLLTPIGVPPRSQDGLLNAEPRSSSHSLMRIGAIGDTVIDHDEALEGAVAPGEGAALPESNLPPGEPTSEDDPLWNIVGMFASSPDGPTDVARNKHKYLAEAYDVHR